MIRLWHTAIAFAAAMLCVGQVQARELSVGPGQRLKTPSAAAAVAAEGDTVKIAPGTYVDCAIWTAPRLTIEGTGPGVVLSGKTCAEKAIFVIEGNDVTVRGITFANATVKWHNGAGIRAAGDNLTVEHSRFVNNENGILAGGGRRSVLLVRNSEFIGNGACTGACAHGIYAGGPIARLNVEDCIFRDTKIAHHIKSRAQSTIVRNSHIEDGPNGTSSYLIDIPDGGDVLIQGNTMEKGPGTSNPSAAVSIGIESVKNQTSRIAVLDNVFRNDAPQRTIFVRNSTAAPVTMERNAIAGDVEPLVNRSQAE